MARITTGDLVLNDQSKDFYVQNTGIGYDSLKKSRTPGKQTNSDIIYGIYREVEGQHIIAIKNDFTNPKLFKKLDLIAQNHGNDSPVDLSNFKWNAKKASNYTWWSAKSLTDSIKAFKGLILVELIN